MLLVINIYDHENINFKLLCENINYKVNVLDPISHLTAVNVFFILYWMHAVELDRIRKNVKCKSIDGVIDYTNDIQQ